MSDPILLHLTDIPLSQRAQALIEAGEAKSKQVDTFDFIPSDYGIVYTVLAAMQRGRFCEWGSGLGIVTGLAEMLGYQSMGIELEPSLVDLSRKLLSDFKLQAQIESGDYFELDVQADLYFVYCWPGRVVATEERFLEIAPSGARLLVYYGRNDIRWIAKP